MMMSINVIILTMTKTTKMIINIAVNTIINIKIITIIKSTAKITWESVEW